MDKKSIYEQETNTIASVVYDYRFYFRLHCCWMLAVVAMFLGPAWWLVPLPGDSPLGQERTYPATILKVSFEGLAVILAARSLVIALVKVMKNGIYPDSVVKFRTTGGIEAMHSAFRYRSGLRYFLVASLLPIAGLLGNLLQAEFQSSDAVYYHLGRPLDAMVTAQCQHTTADQYSLAASAFSQGLVTGSLADASSVLDSLNQSITPIFGLSVISGPTRFSPVSNITVQGGSLTVSGESIMNAPSSGLLRHTDSSGKEAILVITPEQHAGFYISAPSTHFSCFSGAARRCIPDGEANADKTMADALVGAMQSNVESYRALATDVLAGNFESSGLLANALLLNPLCVDIQLYQSPGRILYPYTRASWTILSIIWSGLLVVVWAIGAYLIGYTTEIFYKLAQSGNLLDKIACSSELFETSSTGEIKNEILTLNIKTASLVPLGNFTVTDLVLEQ